MASIVELAAGIISTQASQTPMTLDELIQSIEKVHAALQKLEGSVQEPVTVEPEKPELSIRQAFRKDEIICMVCGKGGFKTLTRHLRQAHDLKPGQYRRQFGIPSSQPLTAKNYSEARRAAADRNDLAANLVKARAARGANKASAKSKAKRTKKSA